MSNLLKPERQRRPGEARDREEKFRIAKSAFAVALSLVILLGGGLFAFTKVSGAVAGAFLVKDYPGPGEKDVEVEIRKGASLDEIGATLYDAEVIASTKAFDRAAQQVPNSSELEAGLYQLKTKMRAEDAIKEMLAEGARGGKELLIREGLRLNEQIPLIAKVTEIPEDQYRATLEKPEDYGLPSYANGKPEGYLFPAKYEVSGTNPKTVLKQMTDAFKRAADEVQLEARAKEMNRSPQDLVIVASIIEAEVRRAEDRPKVARVLYNRLESKPPMKLQLDTTVEYAVNKRRGTGATTTDAERANPSPYNTYVHEGLPAGPLNAPGKDALKAAANPADGDWKYFVAINLDTGETAFAKTFAEHEQNVRKFQQWCQANKGKC